MALITCSECMKKVSELAESCPFCGCPLNLHERERERKNNDHQTILLILSILAIFVSLFYIASISMLRSNTLVYLSGNYIYQIASGLLMLLAGIIYISTYRMQSSIGLKTAYWFYLISALCSFANSDIFTPVMLIFPVLNLIYGMIFVFLSFYKSEKR